MNEDICLERIAIHEASHAVVAKLFEDNLYIKYITIKPSQDENGNKNIGANKIFPKDNPWIAPAVVSLAGMVGEKIRIDGIEHIKKEKETILSNPESLKTEIGGGDLVKFYENLAHYGWKYESEKKFQDLCLSCIIDFLSNENVWNVVKEICEEILKKENQTLDSEELENIFQRTGLTTFLEKTRTKYLNSFVENENQDSQKNIIENLLNQKDCDLFNNNESQK